MTTNPWYGKGCVKAHLIGSVTGLERSTASVTIPTSWPAEGHLKRKGPGG